MEPDFSGYATKADLKCSDGRTITAEAFKEMDGTQVPLVWQHGHDDVKNVLGHVILEARPDGVYCNGFFNDTDSGEHSKKLVKHGDVKALSIFANSLLEKSKRVLHGKIREVSLVISGANPGAFIDYVRVAHSDDPNDFTLADDMAYISFGIPLEHGVDLDAPDAAASTDTSTSVAHAKDSADEDLDTQSTYESLTPDQKKLFHMMVEAALEADADVVEEKALAQSSTSTDTNDSTDSTDSSTQTKDNEGDLAHQEGTSAMTTTTTHNVFDQNDKGTQTGPTLSHSDLQTIFQNAKEGNGSFKKALADFIQHSDSLQHSITNIEILFPDAKTLNSAPEWVSRRMEWVDSVLSGVRKSPFAKVKTILADITAEEARAKGYVKGAQKVDEVLVLLARTTGPTTIYKKQSLDRDDLLDITDIDIVVWLKAEMRIMIEEELARAILVGDGRTPLHADKVKDPSGATDGTGIRSILNDNDLYAIKHDLAANVSIRDAVKGLIRARSKYRGSGQPTLFISDAFLTDVMLEEDKFERPLYKTQQELMDKLRVKAIVTVDLFDEYADLFAIMVSLSDYTIGTNKGGELTSFEDFDIDVNKHKYLQETRLSGALTKPFSAVVVRRSEGTLAVATAPSFDGTTNTITIPTVTGVVYLIDDEVVTGDVVITSPKEVEATPADGYYLAANTTRSWYYTP